MTAVDPTVDPDREAMGGADPDRLVEIDDFLGDPDAHGPRGLPRTIIGWLTTTDHKALGIAYIVTSMVFLGIGGALAGVIRAELAEPGLQLVSVETYNSVFTIHGSVMVYLFAVPFGFGMANYLLPLQIGAPDLAFPRLNAFSYWLYLIGGAVMLLGFVADGGAASFGWFAYPPLSGAAGTPGIGADMWIVSIILTGTSGTLTAVNVIATVTMMRTPGMTLFRMPILTWNMFITSFMVLVAFPVLSGALLMLLADRQFGTHFFDPVDGGSPILWQHLFWFFGHPEVYIVALPFFGVVTEIFPVFSRRPVFGYKGLVLATLAIGALSTSVWAHHMFATGDLVLPFFAATSLLIGVPTGVKIFNWIGTMWDGSLSFEAPMKFAIGFLVTFVAGGVTGIMLASPTLDFHLTDSYFVVAHFHYVMGGTVIFAMFAAIYFWWPKVTGRLLSEKLGTWHFWLLMAGFNVTFFVQHLLGRAGMPRRVPDYRPIENFELWNKISSFGFLILVASMVPFLINVVRSLRSPATVGADPWHANSLEWATFSPPADHNFTWLPPIRSERPVFDLRWINFEGVGAPTSADAWEARHDHDEQWLPLHQWSDEEEQKRTTGPRPIERTSEGQSSDEDRADGDRGDDGEEIT
ncbi:cytochrome c oxidase subunit I [Ilumatobacter nonamiensis]|uniref:cytochrome c oxidase subunit I n=1 Tax=Ilumatobacter nonamiensis TaxID=467093 RepID=UPI00034B02AE|nr:cytochrome c oxidase subunit I [Ilumatobacter nonamiensis]